MLDIINYQRNSNQTHNKIPLHIHQDDYNNNNKNQTISVGKDLEESEYSYTAVGYVKQFSYFGKLVVSQTTKHRIPNNPENPLLAIYPREMITYVHIKMYT